MTFKATNRGDRTCCARRLWPSPLRRRSARPLSHLQAHPPSGGIPAGTAGIMAGFTGPLFVFTRARLTAAASCGAGSTPRTDRRCAGSTAVIDRTGAVWPANALSSPRGWGVCVKRLKFESAASLLQQVFAAGLCSKSLAASPGTLVFACLDLTASSSRPSAERVTPERLRPP